jgi:hypothetical protein
MCVEGEAEAVTHAQMDLAGASCLLGRTTWSRLQARWPPASIFFSESTFSIKITVIFFPEFIFDNTYVKKPKKMVLLKTASCRFISYMVRFWSKTMSIGLGKVYVFWIHQLLTIKGLFFEFI